MKIKKFIEKHKYLISFGFLILCFSLFMSITINIESDYFWHIKAGEYMFNNAQILTKDVFSWFMSGNYWMSHEWAFDFMIYLLKHLFGQFHLFIYSFGCIILLLSILFFSNKDNYKKNTIFSLIWMMFFLIFSIYIQVRPHLLSFSFLALTIYFLYDLFKNENSKKIYFLPLITILWSNFHGGSSNLSYIFCFVFLIIGLFKFNFKKIQAKRISKIQIKKYLIVGLICMVATCINPHGIKMFIYPYLNLLDDTMLNFIAEWQPTTLSNIQHLPYFILICFLFFMMLFSDKKIDFIDLALFGISIILGLKSIRFWGYTYIIMNFVIFNYIKARKNDKGTCIMLILLGGLFLLIFISNTKILKNEYNQRKLSDNLIQTIKEENPSRLYNMYDYGGELVYNDIKVFIDGRADLYSKFNLKDYEDISLLKGDFISKIKKYNFDYFLVSKDYLINSYLNYSNEYEKIYSENNIVLYKKRFD